MLYSSSYSFDLHEVDQFFLSKYQFNVQEYAHIYKQTVDLCTFCMSVVFFFSLRALHKFPQTRSKEPSGFSSLVLPPTLPYSVSKLSLDLWKLLETGSVLFLVKWRKKALIPPVTSNPGNSHSWTCRWSIMFGRGSERKAPTGGTVHGPWGVLCHLPPSSRWSADA